MVDFVNHAGKPRRSRYSRFTESLSKAGAGFCIIFTVMYVLTFIYEHAHFHL